MKFIELKRQIDEVPELATLPGITAELLSILQSKKVSIESVTALVETDPALTTKILRASNTSDEKLKYTTDTVRDAISHLGLNRIRTILFQFTVYSKLFRLTPKQQELMHVYWIHSVACAHVCRILAARFGIKTENREFTAGLLHDLGKLFMIQFYPDQCVHIQQSISQTSMNDIDAENKVLGATHATIGGWLAEKWNLPPVYAETMKYHHDPSMATIHQALAALVNFAEICCCKIGYGFMEGNSPVPIDHSRGWAFLEPLYPGLQKMHENKLLTSIKNELETQPGFSELVRGDNLFHKYTHDNMMNVDTLRASVDRIQDFASLPSIATELFTFLDDPNVSLGKLSVMLKGNPALNDSVLRIVNSPFYDFDNRIRTIQQAAAFLGLTEFTSLLVTTSIISNLYGEKWHGLPKIEAYWDHAIGCGMIAHYLASQLSLPTRGREFTAGVLHDLGKLVLLEHYSAASSLIDLRMQGENCTDIEAEMAIIGVPHTEIGTWIAEKWNLHPSYIDVLRFHHVPSLARVNISLVAVVHVADILLQGRNIGLSEGSMRADITTDEGWLALKKIYPAAQAVDPMKLVSDIPFSVDDVRQFLGLISGPGGEDHSL